MEFVRRFLRTNFGEDAVNEGQQILLNLFEEQKRMDASNPYAFRNTIHECGAQIAANLSYGERLQLLDFLVKISQSDGHVCQQEIEALKEVAQAMQLSEKEVESMLNLGGDSLAEIRLPMPIKYWKSIRQPLTKKCVLLTAVLP